MAKTNQLNIRVDAAERQALRDVAKRVGVSVSDMFRCAIPTATQADLFWFGRSQPENQDMSWRDVVRVGIAAELERRCLGEEQGMTLVKQSREAMRFVQGLQKERDEAVEQRQEVQALYVRAGRLLDKAAEYLKAAQERNRETADKCADATLNMQYERFDAEACLRDQVAALRGENQTVPPDHTDESQEQEGD